MNRFPIGSSQAFIQSAKHFRRVLDMSKLSLDEFASNVLLGASQLSDPCDDETARAVADTVPDGAISLVFKEIDKILSPNYRCLLHIGAPYPTPEAQERMRLQYETRMIEAASAIKAALKCRSA